MVWDHEVAGSNPVAPTVFTNEPFGEDTEGLFRQKPNRRAVRLRVQLAKSVAADCAANRRKSDSSLSLFSSNPVAGLDAGF